MSLMDNGVLNIVKYDTKKDGISQSANSLTASTSTLATSVPKVEFKTEVTSIIRKRGRPRKTDSISKIRKDELPAGIFI
jgi:hypothetical protein